MNPFEILLATLMALTLYILINDIFFNFTYYLLDLLLAYFTDLYFFYHILYGSLGFDLVELYTKYGINLYSF